MELSATAQWLDSAFAVFDYAILGALHMAAEYAGGFLTPLMKLVTLLGEKGLLMFLTALVLLCFARTRKLGLCVFGAVCCGALITNIILKDLVARPRPFESYALYRQWWTALGSPAEDGFSFPSGHMTAITAGMTALCLGCRRRNRSLLSAGAVVAVLLMALSRSYLMAHYPSDVLFAGLIGLFSAVVAYAISQLIYGLLEDYDELPLCADILDFDLRWIPELVQSGLKTRALKAQAAEIEDDFSFFPEAAPAPEPAPDAREETEDEEDWDEEDWPVQDARPAHAPEPYPEEDFAPEEDEETAKDASGSGRFKLPKLKLSRMELPKIDLPFKESYKGKH